MLSSPSRKTASFIKLLVVAVILISGWMAVNPAAASSRQPRSVESLIAAPTPSPAPETAPNPSGVSPLVGILVLLVPLALIAWNSRGVKEPKITASCCLPVVDSGKRPFAVPEDALDPRPPKRK